MRIISFCIALLVTTPVVAQTCPELDEYGESYDALLDEVRIAPTEMASRLLTNQLWEIWATAPDEIAQEMLDRGLRARESYDFDRAVAAFDELVEYCPNYAEGYNQRAFVAFIRQDYPAALEDLERAIALSPTHIAALSGQALTLMGLGRTAAAQSILREALEMNPWLPERYLLSEEPGQEL